MSGDEQPTLDSAANQFLASLPAGEAGESQQLIYKFIGWFGRKKLFNGLAPADMEKYAEQLSTSDTRYLDKLARLKAFMAYGKKNGWSETNLGNHLKAKKVKANNISRKAKPTVEAIEMTARAYEELEAQIAALKDERHIVIEETRKAAADKDFRENAPLHAAREKRGHLEGRIMELESTLRAAVIVDNRKDRGVRAGVGDKVTLESVPGSEQMVYTLVSPREVDAANGKISTASPIGKAIMGKKQGDKVEITVPVGTLRYVIRKIEQ